MEDSTRYPASAEGPTVAATSADLDSVVQAERPFTAEVARRRSTRALVAGFLLFVILIAGLAAGGLLLKNYRERWNAERAEKAKADKDKLVTTRRGREFRLQARDPEEPPAIPLAAGSPPLKPVEASTPARTPPGAGGPPAQPKPAPPPPPMMMASTGSAAPPGVPDDTRKPSQEDLPPQRQSVQAFAQKDLAGKPPTTSRQAAAATLGDRSFLIARGSWIPCILETQLDTTVPGNTSCVIPEDVYSDDGKQLLLEKGSRAVGSFGDSLRRGDTRIAVTWARLKTTRGVVIDVESPATDGVGTSGAGGFVDNQWPERVGAALLLSFVQDAVGYAIAEAQRQGRASDGNVAASRSGVVVYVPENTSSQGTRLAEKILDSTINVPPTLYKNRGDRVMIFVNRDLWFDSTYQLVRAN